MKHTSPIRLALALLGAMSAMAQTKPQPPQPDPELKKQDFFVGNWTLEGKSVASPFGPGGQSFKSTESL